MSKPPTLPPRNPLLQATGKIGRRAPLSYVAAMRRQRELVKLEKAVAPKAKALGGPLGVILPNTNPRAAAKLLMTGINERAERKAKRKAEEAKARMLDEMQRVGFVGTVAEFTAANDEIPPGHAPTNRPPRPEPGRYDGLKNGGQEPA